MAAESLIGVIGDSRFESSTMARESPAVTLSRELDLLGSHILPPLAEPRGSIWDPGSGSDWGKKGDLQFDAGIEQLTRIIQALTASVQHLRGTPYRDALMCGVKGQGKQTHLSKGDPIQQAQLDTGALDKNKRDLGRKNNPPPFSFSSRSDRCFRCGERGHFAQVCRNAVVCFTCGKLGHRSFQCRDTRSEKGGKGGLIQI